MNEKELFELWEKNLTNYSVNSEFKCCFEFFPPVLVVIGIIWYRDWGIVVEKGNFSEKWAICSVKKINVCRKKRGDY